MDLSSYLKTNGIKVPDFAKRIGRSRKRVYEYMHTAPPMDVMERILTETNGAVTPNDWLQESTASQ